LRVLKSNLTNLLIGINIPYHETELNFRTDFASKYWKKWFKKYKFKLIRLINKNKKYYSASITRYYSIYKNKKKYNTLNYIKKLKKIWEKRDVLIIEGFYTRNGIGNDLFNNTNSIHRIICPAKNAFSVYDKIITEVKRFLKLKLSRQILVLISLGPTAVSLTYDLYKLGFQVIDIGHVDIEYELYLRKYDIPTKIKYKLVNEAKDGDKNITNITDKTYYKQILCQIN
jgi:glycosyltransferase family protein